jgi:DNA repair exonuclease SbcCD ATPase subunit
MSSIFQVFLEVEENSANHSLLMVKLSEISTAQEKNDKKNDKMLRQLLGSIDQLTIKMTKCESENDELRKTNNEMQELIKALQNENQMVVSSKKESSTIKEEMKVKDFMIANLQKENSELKKQRAFHSRELESVREQIKELKVTAKGESKRQPLKDANQQSVVLTFNCLEDEL